MAGSYKEIDNSCYYLISTARPFNLELAVLIIIHVGGVGEADDKFVILVVKMVYD